MAEVRGAELKTKGGPKLKIKGPSFFFGKFYILKKKIFGPRGGPGPLSPSPGSVPECEIFFLIIYNIEILLYPNLTIYVCETSFWKFESQPMPPTPYKHLYL